MNAAQKEIFAGMVAKASELTVGELKDKIAADVKEPILYNVVFDALCQALEAKIGEQAMADFCDSIEM